MSVHGLGANTGKFSRIARACGFEVCAWDVDPACVDNHYRSPRASSTSGILPLLLDLTNPTPAFGWDHSERMSLRDRGPADVLLALGLIHHLAIGNNVPLPRIAEMLANLGRWLIIEFVPKVDSQVRKLLASRADVFPDYDIKGFADAFSQRFRAVAQRHVNGSERTLFLMERLND